MKLAYYPVLLCGACGDNVPYYGYPKPPDFTMRVSCGRCGKEAIVSLPTVEATNIDDTDDGA